MTKITDNIWIGDSNDAVHADLQNHGIDGILNCAFDLQGMRGWTDGIHYAQCGLIDGPGNSMASYYSAVLQLAHMIAMGKKVLVHCHKGESRSVAVVIYYLHLQHGRQGWEHYRKVIADLRQIPPHTPHEAHRSAFNVMDWKWLGNSVG